LANGTNSVNANVGADYSVTGGTGADTVAFGANLTANDFFDGGTGSDVITITGAATGSNKLSNVETVQVNFGTAATFTTGAMAPGVASTITAAGSTAAVTLDASAYAVTTSLTIIDGAGNDTITGPNANDAVRALTTVTLSTGGADTINVKNAAHDATTANAVTVNNFTTGAVAGSDVLKIATAQVFGGDYRVVTALNQDLTVGGKVNPAAGQYSVVEINQAVATTTNLSDVADGGLVEQAIAAAVGNYDETNDYNVIVVLYGSGAANGNAGVYAVDLAANANVGTANITVELIGIVNGVAADSFVTSNFA
jgi:hypothetical protein